MKLLEKFTVCNDLDLCMSQLERNANLAVAVSRKHAHNSHLISISEIYCFEKFETIHEYALKFLLRKDFQLLDELNQFIQMASAGGLIEKWRSVSKIRSQAPNVRQFDGIIRLDTYYGIFIIFFTFYAHVIAFMVFEKVISKKAREPNPSCFLLFIEMVIDPYRHFWTESILLWKY